MIHLVPAYGRSYKTREACMIDWNAGKDFRIWQGPYCSIRDLEQLKETYDAVEIAISPYQQDSLFIEL